MERADQNIDELLENLHGKFHRLRQSGIDEELFDVIAGFEALSGARTIGSPGPRFTSRRCESGSKRCRG